MISDSLFNKVWQKQRLMATAMQHDVEQSVIGYRCCHIRSLQGQAYRGFIPFLQAIEVENLFKSGERSGDGRTEWVRTPSIRSLIATASG